MGIAKALFVGTTANIAGTTTLAGVTATSITDSGLTSGRVTYAGTAGLLQDSAAFTFDGTTLTATKLAGAHNGTVGATTPSTGAFTTLSASDQIAGNNTASYQAIFKGWGPLESHSSAGAIVIGGNSTNRGEIHYWYNTSTAPALYIDNTRNVADGKIVLRLRTNGTAIEVGSFTSTGLAVTGTLSVASNSGSVFTGSNGTSGNTQALRITSTNTSAGTVVIDAYTYGTNSYGALAFNVGNAGTYAMTLDASGNLLVGGTAQSGTANRVAVFSANKFGLSVIDTTAQTTGVGGALNLGGNYRSAGDAQAFARVAAAKENSTDADYAYAMTFSVTPNGGGFTERMRISSAGIVTMNAYGVGSATFSAAGVISSVSDETWKIKDGAPVDPDAMLNKLEPGYWYYNDEKKETFGKDRQLGFYAQNVNAAIGPEAAPEPEKVTTKNDDGTETIVTKPWGYYDRSVLAVTVMSLQKALATIESLTTRITALENK